MGGTSAERKEICGAYADGFYCRRNVCDARILKESSSGGGNKEGTLPYVLYWRLEESARYAAEHGFDSFTSTLFYSIYQQHDLMRSVAERFAKEYGISFYYEDFRVGWQDGIDLSKELGLYRQSYSGCVFSEEERYSRALRKLQRKENKEKKRLRLMA